jgi:hypothetical protein
MTDFRALCAELVEAWDATADFDFNDFGHVAADIVTRARADLAELPVGPTDEELIRAAKELHFVYEYEGCFFTSYQGDSEIKTEVLSLLRAVLARWGTLAIQPVPVSERLPGPDDCDAEGLCLWWSRDTTAWCLCFAYLVANGDSSEWTHWLPHWALPVPTPVNTINQEGT